MPHKFDNEVFINVQQLIPLPEAEDYQVRVRRKGEEKKAARNAGRDGRDFTKYRFKGDEYNKRRLVLAVIKDWVKCNSPQNFNELTQVFPQDIRSGGIFAPLNEAGSRHFTDEEDHVKFDDGSSYVISKQWGGDQHRRFVEIARKLGYEIEAVD